jgi:hypothetical protein
MLLWLSFEPSSAAPDRRQAPILQSGMNRREPFPYRTLGALIELKQRHVKLIPDSHLTCIAPRHPRRGYGANRLHYCHGFPVLCNDDVLTVHHTLQQLSKLRRRFLDTVDRHATPQPPV